MLNEIIYTTVRIDLTIDQENYSNATGFIVKNGRNNQAIITNAHVFKDDLGFPIEFISCSFYIWTQLTNRDKKCVEYSLDGKDRKKIIFYSSEGDSKQIDLCALNINDLNCSTTKQSFIPHYLDPEAFSLGEIALNCLEVSTLIVMIGYPSGIFDYQSKKAVARTGYISSVPIDDYSGERQFLIDIKTMDGSSGSPVFFVQSNLYRKGKERGKLIRDLTEIRFIGIFTKYLKEDLITENKKVKVSKDLGLVLKPTLILEMMEKIFLLHE